MLRDRSLSGTWGGRWDLASDLAAILECPGPPQKIADFALVSQEQRFPCHKVSCN